MRIVEKFQEGGAMPEGAPAPQEQQDPLMQIAQIFAQGLQEQNCEMLAQGAQMFLQVLQQSMRAQQPGPEAGGQPVFKKGGKMVKRVCKRK